jgi:hypothetical protein
MKKLFAVLSVIVALFISSISIAQTKPDFYPGKWLVTVMGTPQGDSKMNFAIERKDGKLTGAVQDSTGNEITKISEIEEKDKTITINFSAQGYDVSLTLDPVDDEHVKGSMMGMFDAKGVRVKESK